MLSSLMEQRSESLAELRLRYNGRGGAHINLGRGSRSIIRTVASNHGEASRRERSVLYDEEEDPFRSNMTSNNNNQYENIENT
jgi:hypothetical protein